MTVPELEVLVLALAAQVARLEERLDAIAPEPEPDPVAAGFARFLARGKAREG
jgi:hypothetical protein